MGVNVEIVRKEMIKPSSPTPHHLKDHKLSFLDQLAPPVYIPLIFFYEANPIHGQEEDLYCQLLKRSLSVALTKYYPLAGRRSTVKNSIDCNDAGALFVEAKVDGDLLHITENPDMDVLKKLLPVNPNVLLGVSVIKEDDDEEEVILAVQINKMGCGGRTAIAVQISHKVADTHSLVTFMNAWAAICHGREAEIVQPWFDLASLYPPIDLSASPDIDTTFVAVTKEKIVTKRLVFDKEKLEILKQTAALAINGSQVDNPTRVEVISALIWKHFLEAKKHNYVDKKLIVALHPVNLRKKMNPSLPDHAFGNILNVSIALPPTPMPMHDHEGYGYQGLVRTLKVAIQNVDGTFVNMIQKVDEFMKNNEPFLEAMSNGRMERCCFSSWSRFPVYEVDYGWGKPLWVTTTTLPMNFFSVILGTKSGDGLEVWINMVEDDASVFAIENIKL